MKKGASCHVRRPNVPAPENAGRLYAALTSAAADPSGRCNGAARIRADTRNDRSGRCPNPSGPRIRVAMRGSDRFPNTASDG
jgi:hypothetical protein